MNSIFIHFNVTAALFFFRDSNKGLFVDNCFMMIGKQIPCSLLALRRVAHENCGCSRTTAIFFIAEKRIDRSSTPFRLSCWRRYGTRFEFVDNTDNTIYILRTNAFECLLKADCRHMMTFVDDDHAVVADPRFDCVCVSKGLKQGNVDDAATGISSTAVSAFQNYGSLFRYELNQVTEVPGPMAAPIPP